MKLKLQFSGNTKMVGDLTAASLAVALLFGIQPAFGGAIYSTDPASVNAGNYSTANIPGLAAGDVIGDFSFGSDPINSNLYFTVDRQAIGAPGSAVADLSDPAINGGANGDIFYSAGGSGTNSLNTYGTNLGLTPGFFGDDITGLSLLPQGNNVYFSLSPGSPTLATLGLSPADIIMSGPNGLRDFARPTTLGLRSGDQLSGLVLNVATDTALFTISSFSVDATTSGGSLDPADVYMTTFNGTNSVYRTAASLGLLSGDQIQAIATMPTPEPSTLCLLLLGGGLLTILRARRRTGHALLVLAAAAMIPTRIFAAETCSTMAGTSPPVANSSGTLILDDLTTTNFHWISQDGVFGAIDTGVVAATTFTVSNGNPPRVVFTGSSNGIKFQGNVILGTYQRGTVNVYTANKLVSYLIAPPTIKVTNIAFDWTSPTENKTNTSAAITMRNNGMADDAGGKLNFKRPPAAPTGTTFGEWVVNPPNNQPALYVASQTVMIKVRFESNNANLLKADISATAQNGRIPNVKSTTVTFTGTTAEYVKMPFVTDGFINKASDTWNWQMGNINGCGTPVFTPAAKVTSGPHTLYTVLALPTSPWYDIPLQQPWVTALDFVTGKVNLIGDTTVASAAATTAYFLFDGYGLIYDSAGGRPNYVANATSAPEFNLTGFIANPQTCNSARPCTVVNCYDLAASAATLINLIGGTSGYRFMEPNGYMATEGLIGRGDANNPFYLSKDGTGAFVYQQPQIVAFGCRNTIVGGKIGRSRFGNHAFVTLPGDLVVDAMGGPFTGSDAIPAYLTASIDANARKAAGMACTDIGMINPVTMKGSGINGGPGDVGAALTITLK